MSVTPSTLTCRTSLPSWTISFIKSARRRRGHGKSNGSQQSRPAGPSPLLRGTNVSVLLTTHNNMSFLVKKVQGDCLPKQGLHNKVVHDAQHSRGEQQRRRIEEC